MNVEVLTARAAIHAALADPHRLAIVDELTWSDRSPSSLASAVGVGSNLLAHHLAILEQAGVVERSPSAGDGRRRYVRLVPEAIASLAEPAQHLVAHHVLFVCTANSARSQIAAAVWNARHEVPASSAGTHPAPAVRSQAIRAAARAGHDLRSARTHSIEDVTEHPDLVITVCDVASEALGTLPDDATLLHWSIADPATADTPDAYDVALRAVTARIDTLAPHVRPPPRRARRTHP
ncbi:MAG: arsenate reductase/protein-tyrosine-phosphatase family protein [Actinomycetota bacterium]